MADEGNVPNFIFNRSFYLARRTGLLDSDSQLTILSSQYIALSLSDTFKLTAETEHNHRLLHAQYETVIYFI
jgi:hypothetical protein